MARKVKGGTIGYTAVEVMMAIAVTGVGIAGIAAAHRSSIVGTSHARSVDMANSIATLWMERLRTDAAAWTLPSASRPNESNLITNTVYLHDGATVLIDRGRNSTDGGWFLPDQALGDRSPAFDATGREVAANSTQARYCTHVRLDCLSQTQGTGGAGQCSLLRASVRVFWPKDFVTATPPTAFCARTNISTADTIPSVYNFVYTTSAIRQSSATDG